MKITNFALASAAMCGALAGAPAWADEWVKCAIEEGICKVHGTAIVKYGADKRWSTRKVTGSVKCSPAAFGDPAVGTHKACSIGHPAGNAGRNQFIDPPTWVKCSNEGGVCRFEGRRRVTYGIGKNWAHKIAVNSISCSPAGFGRDPALGVIKSCYYDAN